MPEYASCGGQTAKEDVVKEGHQYGGGQFNNSRNAFPDGKIVRIAAEAAVKNRAIHKKANIDCKQKLSFCCVIDLMYLMQTNPGQTGDNTLLSGFSGPAGEKCGGSQISKIYTRE